jgi:hypothetical protein
MRLIIELVYKNPLFSLCHKGNCISTCVVFNLNVCKIYMQYFVIISKRKSFFEWKVMKSDHSATWQTWPL